LNGKVTWDRREYLRIRRDTRAVVREFLGRSYRAEGETAERLRDAIARQDLAAYREACKEVRRIAYAMMVSGES
jgi:hypothetical protein